MGEKLWSELINFEEFYKINKTENFYQDDEQEKNFDINNVEFSLNNENILNEINKILEEDNLSELTALELLQKQDLVSSYISKSMQNNVINKKYFYENVRYLKNTSKILSDKLNVKIYNHNYEFVKKEKIVRSSYKFCNYKHSCSYNYDKGKKGCYADHYPHHMVYADCDALLYCIDKYYENDDEISNKELIRCLNTISFVIKHMLEELNNLCLYSKKEDFDKFHFIKYNSKKYNNQKFKDIDI
tara:strand:- start:142 stop:873 length:732 start_codon:yes stop_codon:yes gene_type:complete